MTTDLVHVDYATEIERSTDPVQFVETALERAKEWLNGALEHGDIEQIVELKSQGDAIRAYTMSKNLGKDSELAATEIVRRAEQGLATAVRRGQATGEVKRPGQEIPTIVGISLKPSPSEFFGSESEQRDAYALAAVPPDEFEEAIAKAKAERNLSRANVVRKVKKSENAKPPRRPLGDVAREVGWSIRRDVEKAERIFSDERYGANKEQVAMHLHGHLTYAIEVLARLVDSTALEGDVT